ncbi:hypothetical protein SLEP1_g41217 [Rubroshorea leprosula]|uniref:Protein DETOXIFICATION n=1 Tax=Rubroshorea leprosula TaxID=152421 RepID=A0AAV5L5T6_9ROSI|nr:hypothetical protein SLEP1_g41217 [Rubroshorea leprosula]
MHVMEETGRGPGDDVSTKGESGGVLRLFSTVGPYYSPYGSRNCLQRKTLTHFLLADDHIVIYLIRLPHIGTLWKQNCLARRISFCYIVMMNGDFENYKGSDDFSPRKNVGKMPLLALFKETSKDNYKVVEAVQFLDAVALFCLVELAAVGVSVAIFNQVSRITMFPLMSITTSFVAQEDATSCSCTERDENKELETGCASDNEKEKLINQAVVGDATNVLLDPIFIFILRLGINGAAIAHVISQSVIAFILFGGLRLLLLVKVIAATFCVTVAASLAAKQGSISVAAFQVCLQIWLATSLLADGLAIAGQAILASSFAKKDYEKALTTTSRVLQFALVLGLVLSAILSVVLPFSARLFTKDIGVLQLISLGMPFVVVTQPINALGFAIDGINYGASDFTYSALSMIL